MNYLSRHAEQTVRELAQMFGAVLVTGARQVGKSTMLEHVTGTVDTDVSFVTLDNAGIYAAAHNTPEMFFDYNKPPIFIDEIQKAPSLFPEIKQIVDTTKGKGLFYLSGSEQFEMMANVSESLAGRVGIVNLMGLTLREEQGCAFDLEFMPLPEYFHQRAAASTAARLAPDAVWRRIHRGNMPELLANPSFDWSKYYGAYVNTYLERDVRKLTQVENLITFQTFMAALAARTAQMLNLADVASDVGISHTTAQRWLSILLTSNIVFRLRPYHNNLTKRAIKTPKLYFADTGLAAYLTLWNTPEVLGSGAMAGAFFETFVVGEILRSYQNKGRLDPPLYFYRDKDKREIDLLIHENGLLHPLEIKKAGIAHSGDIAAFRLLDALPNVQRGQGGVICMASSLQPLSDRDAVIPLNYL